MLDRVTKVSDLGGKIGSDNDLSNSALTCRTDLITNLDSFLVQVTRR